MKVQERLKMALFRATTKSLGLCLLWFFCHCFVDGNNIHLRDFHHTHLNDIWLFQNRITGSFYHSFNRNILTRQTSEKVVYKPGLDYLLECFLPSTFARIISALPEKCQTFWNWGGSSPPYPWPVYLWWQGAGESSKQITKLLMNRQI